MVDIIVGAIPPVFNNQSKREKPLSFNPNHTDSMIAYIITACTAAGTGPVPMAEA